MALENILSQEIVQKLGWTLLHFIWQAAAVTILLAILLTILRKSSANMRYIIACAVLGLIVLLPIATMQLVPVSVPQPTASIEPAPAPVIMPAVEIREIPAAEISIPEGPVQQENAGTAYKVSWKQQAADLLEPVLPYIVSAWLLGVFGLSLWHLGGWAQLQRLRKKMVKQVDDSLHTKLRRLSERLRVKRAVQLMESALVQVPTVVGWLRPVILLPASALTGLSSEQLEALLAHELAHIRRYDYLINMLQTVVETLGFYHPAVWWVSHKIRIERENCCDDLAVSISGDRVRYAKALTSMEEIRGRRGELAITATGGNLFARICRLVSKDSTDSSQTSWIPSVVTILLIAIIVIPTTLALTGQSGNKGDTYRNTNNSVEDDEGRIEGRIIDINTGKGISGVHLSAVPHSLASYDRFTCTSEKNGKFTIGGLQSGEYLLQGDLPSVDVDVVSGRCTNDVLIGVDRRKAVPAPKETTAEQQSNGQIIIGMRVIEIPADAMKDVFEVNESLSSGLLVRHGHEIAGQLLTLPQELKDAKQLAAPQVLMNNNSNSVIELKRNIVYTGGYESVEGEPEKLAPQLQQLEIGWKFKIHAKILEGGEKVHIELAVKQQEPGFETRQYRPGYDYQIPSSPDIFATEMTAKNSEPFVIARLRPGEQASCLVVTPSVILPERQPEPLLGKKLPEPDNIQNIDDLKETEGKPTLICFWDMNQRPSRNIIAELGKRENELKAKNIAVVLVDTSQEEPTKLKQWLDSSKIPFACGNIEGDAKKVLFQWGVRAQPWLILTDEEGVVRTEGFGLESLTPEGLRRLLEPAKSNTSTEAQQQFKERMETDMQSRIAELMENALAQQKQQRYEAALGQLEALLAMDPENNRALEMKDSLEDKIWFLEQLDEEDAQVHKHLEEIVDLSELSLEMSFGEVIGELEQAAEPPLQILPHWQDMRETAGIVPTTPVGMAPLTNVKLGKALEILLAGVSSESAKVDYVVDRGVVLIATTKVLPRTMITRVHDITDLVGDPDDHDGLSRMMQAQNLIDFIQEHVSPESWYDLNITSEGQAIPYPIRGPKKLAVLQTLKNQRAVQRLLEKLRSGAEQLDEKLQEKDSDQSLEEEKSRDNLLAKSTVSYSMDKSIVQIDLSVVEVFSDLKMDRETTIAARNLLGPTFGSSTDTANLLKKAAGATAVVKDESVGNKRVAQEQFEILVDLLESRGYVKILMNPTLEVVDGGTAQIRSEQKIPSIQESLVDSIQITSNVSKDTNKILLQVEVNLHQVSISQSNEQTPIVNRHEIATSIRLSPGESGIISGMKQTGLLTEPGKDAKNSEVPVTETLVILTPTIVAPVTEPPKQPQTDTDKDKILIDTSILTVSDEFLSYVGLDPNSVAKSEGWLDYLVHASDDSASFVIDHLHEDLLLRNVAARMRTHKDIQMLNKPQVLAESGKKCEIHILESEYFMLGPPSEPNGSSDGPESKLNRIELGTTIRLTPTLTPDRKNVELDFEWESRRLKGFKKHAGPDGNVQKIPQVAVDSIKTPCTIPDGKTLLITGKKITEQKKKKTRKFGLADLPLIGRLFYSPPQVEETKNLLILVKPIINPPKKAPPEPLLTNPNDPLIKQLEEKFKRSDKKNR